ncbi:MAG: M14 metallopeptidase family protein [Bacteroidota bacterium]
MLKSLPFALCLLAAVQVFGQIGTLDYYFPNVTFDPSIPTPASVLGYEVGDWHVSHDQLVYYMRELDRASDRLRLREYARSHENRPLLVLTATSENNWKRLSSIKEDHRKLCDPEQSASVDIDNLPAVIYQGYSVHGNESSAANAAVLVAYYLAAAQSTYVDSLLEEVVVLIDPCLNPDGHHRFSTWVNSHKSLQLNSDPYNREFNEVWPGGRTNHYWFDLNRDWLPVQHPESQGRIRLFHEWKPNISTDHHEMGSQSTFFFQPGIPSRTNPLTPTRNQELTAEIGEYHAAQLDGLGSLYYSKESFDDFYYGKGSTYPDVNACIGILFEQASSRGHLQNTRNGLLSFPFTIRNQLAASLSTQKAALGMRKSLLTFQRDFYKTAIAEAQKDKTKGFIFGQTKDRARLFHFIEILEQHQIKVFSIDKDVSVKGKTFDKDQSYYVPLKQPQYRLIKSLFETNTKFRDSLFYDVSTWTLPLAFGLDYAALDASVNFKRKARIQSADIGLKKEARLVGGTSDYAYVFRWDSYYAPKALNALLQAGVIAKVASAPFSVQSREGIHDFQRGSILVPVVQNGTSVEKIQQLLQSLPGKYGIPIYAIQSGLAVAGVDLGSNSFQNLRKPKALLLIGEGVRAYDAGEIWHLFDQRYQMPLSLVDVADFGRLDLSKYNTIVMAGGSYGELSKNAVDKMRNWLRKGGVLIPIHTAVNWARGQRLTNLQSKLDKSSQKKDKRRPYSMLSADRGATVTGGAIVAAKADLSHPLLYGYVQSEMALFRRGNLFWEPTKNPYATPLQYTDQPLLSGYMSQHNQQQLKRSAAATVSSMGRGRVICLSDNPSFRAFWYGTNKLLANAIFFGHTIEGRASETVSGGK